MPAFVREADCIGCGVCVDVCPVENIEMNDAQKAHANENCIECGACIAACPVTAIDML